MNNDKKNIEAFKAGIQTIRLVKAMLLYLGRDETIDNLRTIAECLEQNAHFLQEAGE
jgi:hypothetical protein